MSHTPAQHTLVKCVVCQNLHTYLLGFDEHCEAQPHKKKIDVLIKNGWQVPDPMGVIINQCALEEEYPGDTERLEQLLIEAGNVIVGQFSPEIEKSSNLDGLQSLKIKYLPKITHILDAAKEITATTKRLRKQRDWLIKLFNKDIVTIEQKISYITLETLHTDEVKLNQMKIELQEKTEEIENLKAEIEIFHRQKNLFQEASMPLMLQQRIIGITINYILMEEMKGVGFISQESIEELFEKYTSVPLNDACQMLGTPFKDFIDEHFLKIVIHMVLPGLQLLINLYIVIILITLVLKLFLHPLLHVVDMIID